VRKLAIEVPKSFECECGGCEASTGVRIVYADDELISVVTGEGGVSCGAPHPSMGYRGSVFDKAAGRAYDLAQELIGPDGRPSHLGEAIARFIAKAFPHTRNPGSGSDCAMTSATPDVVVPTVKGLTTFEFYGYASRVCDVPIMIPWAELKGALDAHPTLAKRVRAALKG
jgi:hypothetical protein